MIACFKMARNRTWNRVHIKNLKAPKPDGGPKSWLETPNISSHKTALQIIYMFTFFLQAFSLDSFQNVNESGNFNITHHSDQGDCISWQKIYLEHYNTSQNGERREHNIVYGRYNSSVKCIKCLQEQNQKKKIKQNTNNRSCKKCIVQRFLVRKRKKMNSSPIQRFIQYCVDLGKINHPKTQEETMHIRCYMTVYIMSHFKASPFYSLSFNFQKLCTHPSLWC